MGKLLMMLMIILLTVVVGSVALFSEGGIHDDALETRDNSQNVIQGMNNTLNSFGD